MVESDAARGEAVAPTRRRGTTPHVTTPTPAFETPDSQTRASERRARHSAIHRGRHRAASSDHSFERGFAALGELALAGVQVSARATDLATGAALFSVDDHVVMPTASIGKILLLVEVAARIEAQQESGLGILERTVQDAVGDSGIWQHLAAPALPLADLAALIGATSDNLATNVLLRRIGLDAVSARTEQLGLTRTALLDLVRDHRGPDDAPQLSVGSANELTWLLSSLARGEIVDAGTSGRVIGWLSLNSDLSMVGSAFGLDPLAHRNAQHGLMLVNKSGTDAGVRSEVGVLRGPRAGVTYAVSTYFDDTELATRLSVLDGMRTVGLDLLEYVH
jgi:beta-lactamase class A